MTGRELVKLMELKGWRLDRVRGSHYVMVKEGFRSVPVPVHGNRDLPPGIHRAILKQAGLKGSS
jgi:predicted RNA binding protein YcfA (HicA-like mRNA interferase family)